MMRRAPSSQEVVLTQKLNQLHKLVKRLSDESVEGSDLHAVCRPQADRRQRPESAPKPSGPPTRVRNKAPLDTRPGLIKHPRSNYSAAEVRLLYGVFSDYDRSGSGTVDLRELTHALLDQKHELERKGGRHDVSYLDDFADSMFAAADADGDGELSFRELLMVVYPYSSDAELEEMLGFVTPRARPRQITDEEKAESRELFALYDTNHDGYIDFGEFERAMRNLGFEESELRRAFDELDADGDGRIDAGEFEGTLAETGVPLSVHLAAK